MPKNKFQDVVFTIIMASVMVYGMVAYNIVLNTGSLENWVFGAVFHEWPIMVLIAIALELVFVGRIRVRPARPRSCSRSLLHPSGSCAPA